MLHYKCTCCKYNPLSLYMLTPLFEGNKVHKTHMRRTLYYCISLGQRGNSSLDDDTYDDDDGEDEEHDDDKDDVGIRGLGARGLLAFLVSPLNASVEENAAARSSIAFALRCWSSSCCSFKSNPISSDPIRNNPPGSPPKTPPNGPPLLNPPEPPSSPPWLWALLPLLKPKPPNTCALLAASLSDLISARVPLSMPLAIGPPLGLIPLPKFGCFTGFVAIGAAVFFPASTRMAPPVSPLPAGWKDAIGIGSGVTPLKRFK